MPVTAGAATEIYQFQESGSNVDFVTDLTVGGNPHVVISTTTGTNDNQMPYASFTTWIAGTGLQGGAGGLTYDVASLTEESSPVSTDVFILERSGATRKVTHANLLASISHADLASSPTATNVTITNTAGTDATIAAADGVNAGVVLPADWDKLNGNTAAWVTLAMMNSGALTDAAVTGDASTVSIEATNTGSGPKALPVASASAAGVITATTAQQLDDLINPYVNLGDITGTPTIDATQKTIIQFRLQAAAGFVDPNITPPATPRRVRFLVDENGQDLEWDNVPFATGGMRPFISKTGLNIIDLDWTGSAWQLPVDYTELRARNVRPPEVISSDASAFLQELIDKAFSSDQIPEIRLDPRRYRVDSGLTFPNVTASEVRTFVFDGRGAILDFSNAAAGQTLFGRIATEVGMTPSSDTRFWVPTFKNITAFGSDTQHFLKWHIGTQCHIHDIKLSSFDIGIELLWAVQSKVELVNAIDCVRPFRAISGEALINGSNSNSNCNLVKFINCRASMDSATAVGFYLEHAGGAELNGCSIEGAQCDIGFHLLGDTGSGFSTSRNCVIHQPWGECVDINSMFRIQLDKSNVVISDIQIQPNQDTALNGSYINCNGSRRCHFHIEKTRWEELIAATPTRSFFADDQVAGQFENQWTFYGNTVNGGNLVTSYDKWDAGALPARKPTELATFNYG